MDADELEGLLRKHNISLVGKYSQHFLVDKKVIDALIRAANVENGDVVLEIGSGTGSITRELAMRAKKVIAVEIDTLFRPVLEKLPRNVEVFFEDVGTFLSRKKGIACNKIVANIPYTIGENVLQYLIFAERVEIASLIVPKLFSSKVQKHPIFSAFLKCDDVEEVSKNSFYPVPRASSVIVRITRKPWHEFDGDVSSFIRRKLFLQRDKKLKNGLRDALIDLHSLQHKARLTKKNAEAIINSFGLDPSLLEKNIERLSLEQYSEIAERVEEVNY